jgi:hypothetical protein
MAAGDREYTFHITIGPIGIIGPGNKLQRAQRLAGDIRSLVAVALGYKPHSRTKVIRCEVREVGGEDS